MAVTISKRGIRWRERKREREKKIREQVYKCSIGQKHHTHFLVSQLWTSLKLFFNKGVHKLQFSKIFARKKLVWSIMFFFSKTILKYLPLTISCLIAATDCTQLSVTDFAGLCQETKCSNSLCVLEMKIWVTLKPWQFVAIQLNHRR